MQKTVTLILLALLLRPAFLPQSRTMCRTMCRTMSVPEKDRRGCAFLGLSDFARFTAGGREAAGDRLPARRTLTSPELTPGLPANEFVLSWNAETPAGTGLKIEACALFSDHTTRWYVLGLWSPDGKACPRASVSGQRDADGDVRTDTLVLNRPASRLQIRLTLLGPDGTTLPRLKYLGVCALDSRAARLPLEPNRAAWGRELPVPGKTQLGWPEANGWCSPTSTAMALAFWSRRLQRKELDFSPPEAAQAIYDSVYKGTGNWPFNTAFAGSFPGMRAYVTRFTEIRELEDWIAAGLPVVVSVSYDLLKGKERDNDPGHLLVCSGFTEQGDPVLNDPAHHPERGEVCRRVFTRANFLRGWQRSRNTVYLIYPEGAHLPEDRYGHWEGPATLSPPPPRDVAP